MFKASKAQTGNHIPVTNNKQPMGSDAQLTAHLYKQDDLRTR